MGIKYGDEKNDIIFKKDIVVKLDPTVISIVNTEPLSDYFHRLAMGEIPNHSMIYKFGRNAVVGATEVLVATGGFYGLPTVARTVVATSSSGLDVPLGTGARTLEIIGLNQNLDEVSEVIPMGGTSVNLYLRVFRVTVITSGNPSPLVGANQGTVSITQSISGTVMIQIAPFDGQTKTACYTVPRGYIALMWTVDVTTGEGKNATSQLKSRNLNVVDAAFNVKGVRDNYQNSTGKEFKIPIKYTEKTDIVFTSKSASAGTSVSATFLFELIKII